MNKSFDFGKLFKLAALAAMAIVVIGALLLIFFGSNTHYAYSGGNIGIAFYLKAIISVILVCSLVTLYFGIRFRKKHGFKAGLVASFAACVSALTSFFICVIFRAPLCGYAFSVILFAVCISFICSVVHFDFLNSSSQKKSKSSSSTSNPSARGFRRLLLFLSIILIILFVAFISALLLDATLLTFYAFPACITVVFSSVFTFCACGKLYEK